MSQCKQEGTYVLSALPVPMGNGDEGDGCRRLAGYTDLHGLNGTHDHVQITLNMEVFDQDNTAPVRLTLHIMA